MDNVFIKLIKEGKIRNPEDLKKAFRKIAKKTHPDIVGSNKYSDKFMQFKAYFDEAIQFMQSFDFASGNKEEVSNDNYRLMFFHEIKKLDTLEYLLYIDNKEMENKVRASRELSFDLFKKWKGDHIELYISANKDYDMIKNEKQKYNLSNLRKPPLYKNIRPVFFNIANYHITGLEFYKKQLDRAVKPVLQKLEDKNYQALEKYIMMLIDDMKIGPAVFG